MKELQVEKPYNKCDLFNKFLCFPAHNLSN